MGILDIFKTTEQKLREEFRQRDRDALRASAAGIDGFIDAKQAEVDELRAKTEGFLNDIRALFNRGGVGAYLTADYHPKTRFEGLEHGVRRIGIKWTTSDDDLFITLAFALIEKQGEVRVDYIFEMKPLTGIAFSDIKDTKHARLVINDAFLDVGDEFRREALFEDSFKSMRRYGTYEDFQDSKSAPPPWFVTFLKQYIPKVL